MDRRRGYEISRPLPVSKASAQTTDSDAAPIIDGTSWPSTATRPLSDIRELTEPSLIDVVTRPVDTHHRRSVSHRSAMRRNGSMQQLSAARSREAGMNSRLAPLQPNTNESSSEYSTTPEQSSFYTIPRSAIPQRSSSQTHAQQFSRGHARKPSIRTAPPPAPLQYDALTVPNRGQSRSPVKEAGLRLDPITADAARRVPSRTQIRNPHPSDILDFPSYKHPRVRLEIQLSAPLFAGGGTIEGFVKITVDDNERLKHRRSISIGTVSVDLLGYEEVNPSRRATFLALGTDLIDVEHPPPSNMVEPNNPLAADDGFWVLSPSTSALPFAMSLPLNTGPPPFQSKNASIRFLLCTTALIRDTGKHYRVRSSQDVHVLPTYDPEKALTSLSSPLTASDELHLTRAAGGYESVKVTAGLHRQVWVSGSSIFVDVHIANKSKKAVKRLDLNLERNILSYKHAAAATREKSAGQARIFENNQQAMVASTSLRSGHGGWNGIEPHACETRTWDLDLPRGHATVRCGKYFEVRYFLNVTASVSSTKSVSIQLPVILIHMNSLDIVPNSVAQVAAAIEEKRALLRRRSLGARPSSKEPTRERSLSSPAGAKDLRRRPSYAQGRAFAAPRQQSLDRQRAGQADLADLGHVLDRSPRKYPPSHLHGFAIRQIGSTLSFGNLSLAAAGGTPARSPFHSMTYRTPPAKRAGRDFGAGADDGDAAADPWRARLRMMPSLDSVRSKTSTAALHSRAAAPSTADQNVAPPPPPPPPPLPSPRPPPRHPPPPPAPPHLLAPHALGLSTVDPVAEARGDDDEDAAAAPAAGGSRPATSSGFREKLDRSRFEFKAVRRKASGGLVERGMHWWGHVTHRDRDRDREQGKGGWI